MVQCDSILCGHITHRHEKCIPKSDDTSRNRLKNICIRRKTDESMQIQLAAASEIF